VSCGRPSLGRGADVQPGLRVAPTLFSVTGNTCMRAAPAGKRPTETAERNPKKPRASDSKRRVDRTALEAAVTEAEARSLPIAGDDWLESCSRALRSAGRWEWRSRGGPWTPYDRDASEAIEAAMADGGKASVSVAATRRHDIDFSRMQFSCSSGASGPLRHHQTTAEVDEIALLQFWLQYAEVEEGQDCLVGPSILKLFEDLDIDASSDVRALIFANECRCSKFGRVSRTEFLAGCISLAASNLDELRIALQRCLKLFDDDPAVAKRYYHFAFRYSLDPPSKVLQLDVAKALWSIFLSPRWGLAEKWLAFVEEKCSKAVTQDQWHLLYDFAMQTQTVDDLQAHDEAAGWPTLIDEFVEWVKT